VRKHADDGHHARVLLKHQEMNLVQVEFMILHCLLLNYLHSHSTLVGNDGRVIERVEQRWRRAVDGDEEVGRTGRIGGISQHFRVVA
jgi:hypothetical protein